MSKEYRPPVVFAARTGTGIVLSSLTGPSARLEPVPSTRRGTRTMSSNASVGEVFRIITGLSSVAVILPLDVMRAQPPPPWLRLVPQLEQRSADTTARWGHVAPSAAPPEFLCNWVSSW